jgi:putative transposase of IS4/5 family DUF4096
MTSGCSAGRARRSGPTRTPPGPGGVEAGCTWFGAAGEPYAVIPAATYDHCLVPRFDLESGAPLGEVAIRAAPAGIEPVHHPGGWVGLSEGEGQDAARAWWVRSAASPAGPSRIEVRDAGWDHWVLSDVDHSGGIIITTPHGDRLKRHGLSDAEWARLELLLPVHPWQGHRWKDRRLVIDGIFFRTQNGCP